MNGRRALRQLVAAARRFAAAGGSTVVISHKINEILAVADRIVVMKDGAVVDDRPRAGFTREGITRGAQWRDGAYHDGVLYAVLRTDLA